MITCTIPVSPSYKVHIGSGLLAEAGSQINKVLPSRRTVIVTESTVAPLYLEKLERSLQEAGIQTNHYIFPAGEESKNWTVLGDLLEHLMDWGLTRSDYLIALGGGVTGDLTGFAASIYLRGIPFVQIPTTLLAAVDSSVGGKTAVDLGQSKNQVGTFHQPALVLCDTDTLRSLPRETWLDGVAESIKYGILRDADLYEAIARGDMQQNPEPLIASCINWKGVYVQADEHDHGQRQFLNLGHTFAHGIETNSHFAISHGHAVAMGMILAARTSLHLAEEGLLTHVNPDLENKLRQDFTGLGLPVDSPYPPSELASHMWADKKRQGGTINLVLPLSVGDCILLPLQMSDVENLMNKLSDKH